MNKISIKYLEQRMDIKKEMEKLHDLISLNTIGRSIVSGGKHIFLEDILENHFEEFPLSGTSRDIFEFFEDRNIHRDQDDYYIYLLNFYSNFLSWITTNNEVFGINIIDHDSITTITKRIDLILVTQNYKNILSESINEFGFYDVYTVKRDEDIDSVLEYISPDLRLDLLSYIDFRFEKNIKHKEAIIARLYKDIESKKTTLNCDPFKSLYTDTKFALNIPRHHREYTMTDEEKILWYDRSFRMYVHLIRSQEIKKYQSELKKLGPLLNK